MRAPGRGDLAIDARDVAKTFRSGWLGRRVTGIDVIPLAELGRPRIDVTLRISGFFRDAFPNLVHLVDDAIQTVAALDEPPEQNFVRKHVMADRDAYRAAGVTAEAAQERSLYRIFGSKPGTYGAGILPL